ncbi:MAG: ribosomal protein S18-alanine N-acetyltransferase [Acidobacteria bacterium]|nr:ribosomal protein S18-alanine N-acetyltransferase [Acidobacteriota bacterium]
MADVEPLTWQVTPLAGPADLDGVIAIEDATFNNPTTRAWYEAELARPEVCRIFVLRLANRPVAGFVAFWRVLDEMHINNLAIAPDLRRHGWGRRLLEATLDAACDLGIRHASLEVRRSNDAARRLYEIVGFRPVGVRASYYSQPVEDAIVLATQLNPRAQGGRVRD